MNSTVTYSEVHGWVGRINQSLNPYKNIYYVELNIKTTAKSVKMPLSKMELVTGISGL